MTAPVTQGRFRSKVKHLADADTWEDVAGAMDEFQSFRTWKITGLRGRSRSDYYTGYRFTETGRLQEPYQVLFKHHADDMLYVVYCATTPLAWYVKNIGWVRAQIAPPGIPDDTFQLVSSAVERLNGRV